MSDIVDVVALSLNTLSGHFPGPLICRVAEAYKPVAACRAAKHGCCVPSYEKKVYIRWKSIAIKCILCESCRSTNYISYQPFGTFTHILVGGLSHIHSRGFITILVRYTGPPLLDHVVVLHDCLGQSEPGGGGIHLPECRQLHLVGNHMLHWPNWESPPPEPGVGSLSGNSIFSRSQAAALGLRPLPVALMISSSTWVVVIFVPGRPVTCVLCAHFSVGVTSVRVADILTIFLISHLAHLHIYWLADYHTYILVDLLLYSSVTILFLSCFFHHNPSFTTRNMFKNLVKHFFKYETYYMHYEW